jgi:O-antigen/teichoic acid export membrane protein
MIPTVSAAMSEGKNTKVNAQIENAISFSIVLASCFVPIFASLGSEIGSFVYGDAAAGRFIKVSSWLLIPLAIESITSSVMNSLDLEMKSFINYLIGAAVTFGICFAFFGNFTVEVFSFAQGVGWCVSTILHILAIKKKTGLQFSFAPKLIFCVLLIAPSKLLSSLLYSLFSFTGTFTALAITSVFTMAFFLLLCLVFGVLKINLFSSKRKKLLYKGKSLAK